MTFFLFDSQYSARQRRRVGSFAIFVFGCMYVCTSLSLQRAEPPPNLRCQPPSRFLSSPSIFSFSAGTGLVHMASLDAALSSACRNLDKFAWFDSTLFEEVCTYARSDDCIYLQICGKGCVAVYVSLVDIKTAALPGLPTVLFLPSFLHRLFHVILVPIYPRFARCSASYSYGSCSF